MHYRNVLRLFTSSDWLGKLGSAQQISVQLAQISQLSVFRAFTPVLHHIFDWLLVDLLKVARCADSFFVEVSYIPDLSRPTFSECHPMKTLTFTAAKEHFFARFDRVLGCQPMVEPRAGHV